jgi:cell division protein FtsB
MAAFGLGDNDRMIGFADAQGVAFAAIQGLDAKLQERESAQRADTKAAQDEIDALRREVAELGRALHALATRLSPDAIAEVAR